MRGTETPAYPTIAALDGSTDITGVVILVPKTETVEGEETVRYTAYGRALDARVGARLSEEVAVSRDDMMARLARIRWTRCGIARFLTQHDISLDTVAYEKDTGRGHFASQALQMATGAYLSVSRFARLPLLGVMRQEACSASGTFHIYREAKGKTQSEQDAKKRKLKNAVVLWAIKAYPSAFCQYSALIDFNAGVYLPHHLYTLEMEAIADALAVGQVAINKHMAMVQVKADRASQRRLRIPKAQVE